MSKNSRGRFSLIALVGGTALAGLSLFAGALSSRADPTPTAPIIASATAQPTETATDTPTPPDPSATPTSRPTATRAPSSTPVPTQTQLVLRMATIDISGSGGQTTCCKVCGPDSQACGDSCISKNKTCHKGPGCACQ